MKFITKKNKDGYSSWFDFNYNYTYLPPTNIEAMSSLKREHNFDEKKPIRSTGFSWSA